MIKFLDGSFEEIIKLSITFFIHFNIIKITIIKITFNTNISRLYLLIIIYSYNNILDIPLKYDHNSGIYQLYRISNNLKNHILYKQSLSMFQY
jgi:hypothetical protein